MSVVTLGRANFALRETRTCLHDECPTALQISMIYRWNNQNGKLHQDLLLGQLAHWFVNMCEAFFFLSEPHRSHQPGELHQSEGGTGQQRVLRPTEHVRADHSPTTERGRQRNTGQPVQEHHVCHQVSHFISIQGVCWVLKSIKKS